MSEPEPPTVEAAVPPVAAAHAAEPAASAPVPAALPDPSVPALVDTAFRPQRKPRPLLGASLWLFGALAWAFAVMGEYTVSAKLPEFVAGVVVLGAVGFTWLLAVQRGLVVSVKSNLGLVVRYAVPAFAALALSFASLVFASAFQESERTDRDGVITFSMIVVGLVAFFVGRRLTGPVARPATLQRRVLFALGWIACGLATLFAVVRALR